MNKTNVIFCLKRILLPLLLGITLGGFLNRVKADELDYLPGGTVWTQRQQVLQMQAEQLQLQQQANDMMRREISRRNVDYVIGDNIDSSKPATEQLEDIYRGR